MNEKFYAKKSDIEALINLYQYHSYEAMSVYLLRLLMNTDHYKLLELMERYYTSDNGYGLQITVGEEWIINLTHDTVSRNHYMSYDDVIVKLECLHLPTDIYEGDKEKVLAFIELIPVQPE